MEAKKLITKIRFVFKEEYKLYPKRFFDKTLCVKQNVKNKIW